MTRAAVDVLGATLAGEIDVLGATIASAGGPPIAGRVRARGTQRPAHRRYVIERELARGGMGRISIAKDTLLDRTVALKELLVPDGELGARFERELALTSRLQHPSIVAIHDGGVWPSGEPYYVMKLVTGEPLDRVIARHPTPAARLALLPHGIAVADALAYAHGHHIIHRDLKPANVLVGEFGETVVIDWGLAKDTRQADASEPLVRSPSPAETMTGAVLGTPSYMPPEQAHGETVDERADVYAIGALLYHVLAGHSPYRGRTVEEILVAVTSGPPRSLAELVPGVPVELITIVEKAMAYEPGDRYSTAAALSADLKRFQQGQLVASHQYTAWQLLRRWLRKHRTPVAVGLVAAIALAMLGVTSFTRIVNEQHIATTQRAQAVASRDDADRLLDLMLGDVRAGLEPIGKLDLLDKVAREARGYYERRPAATTSVDLSHQALAWQTLGDVLRGQGHLPEAMSAYKRALAIEAGLQLASPGDTDRTIALASAHRSVADVLADQGNVVLAIDELRREQSMIESAAAAKPADLGLARNATVARLRIGDMLLQQGKTDAAMVEFRAVLATRDRIAAAEPATARWQADVAAVQERIGELLRIDGNPTSALEPFRAARETMTALVLREPSNTDFKRRLLMDHDRVGSTMLMLGNATEAQAQFRSSLALGNELTGLDPTNTTWQADVADSHDNLSRALVEAGKTAEGLHELRASVAIRDRLAAADPTNAAWVGSLAVGRLQLGEQLLESDPRTAIAELRKSRELAEQIAARDQSNLEWQSHLSNHHSALGDALLATGDVAGALVELRASLAIRERLLASDPDRGSWQGDVADAHAGLGMALQDAHDLAHAEHELVTAVDMRERIVSAAADNLGAVRALAGRKLQLAQVLIARREYADAAVQFDGSCKLGAKVAGADPENTGLEQDLAQAHLMAAAALRTHDRAATLAHRRAAKQILAGLRAATTTHK